MNTKQAIRKLTEAINALEDVYDNYPHGEVADVIEEIEMEISNLRTSLETEEEYND